MHDNSIEATILTEPAGTEIATIHRILKVPIGLPFQFKIRQLSIKDLFVITFNKAQGRTFQCVFIDLRSDRFPLRTVVRGIINNR